MSTWNPNAFSNSGGTYLSSLFRRTHSFSSGDFRYSPGEIFSSFTICSNEFGNETGRIDPGFVKLRFTERRIMHLSTSDLSTSPGPEDQPNLKMPAQVIFFEPPPALPNKLFSHGTGDLVGDMESTSGTRGYAGLRLAVAELRPTV